MHLSVALEGCYSLNQPRIKRPNKTSMCCSSTLRNSIRLRYSIPAAAAPYYSVSSYVSNLHVFLQQQYVQQPQQGGGGNGCIEACLAALWYAVLSYSCDQHYFFRKHSSHIMTVQLLLCP